MAENRARYDRSKLRYPSDLTDQEWSLIELLIPPAKRGGNRWTVVVRDVVDGVMYILSTGCQWSALPKDLPPRALSTITFVAGMTTARSIASITRFIFNAGNWPNERPVRRLRSLTARA
jgi:transposase